MKYSFEDLNTLLLEVDPSDFYYLNRVTTHEINEQLAKTWLLYKVRNLFGNSKRASKSRN